MVNRALIVATGLLVLGVFTQLRGGQSDPKTFMRVKLEHARKVLEGLTTENYDSIAQSAGALTALSQDTDWNVIQTEEYRRQSEVFRRDTRALVKAAQDENLDGATLAYLRATITCIECHKHVREAKRQAQP